MWCNVSATEIKEVKRRKERAKELEGIDLSNIVSSTRRRSTTSFVPPPEDEREEFLSKELEDILSREGLSSNPSEKGNAHDTHTHLLYALFLG